MAVNHLLLLLLSLLTVKTGFSAEIPVFVQTGASVHMDLQTQEPPPFDILFWRNDKSETIVRYISDSKTVKYTDSSYKDRVDFNEKTFSLTLKDMQKTDSGLYTAKTTGDSEKDIVTYRVSVIDAVEAPVLTVNSNWSSSDSCTVNVTCRGHDLMIDSSYQNNECSSEEVTSHEKYTLILYCSEESIICNYSNPVSWKNEKLVIKKSNLCFNKGNHPGNVLPVQFNFLNIVLTVIGFLVILFLLLLLYCHIKNKKGAHVSGTVYAEVQPQELQTIKSEAHTYDVPERVQAQTQEEIVDNPTTTYCTVGQHQKHNIQDEKETTIYSTVCKQPLRKQPAIPSNG